MLKVHSKSLNDESFRTILTEVEAIVNSRPLTVETLSDPCTVRPISPSMLLTQKSDVILPPPGCFGEADIYSRKQWRRVQHLANSFWSRWRKEFLSSLQERPKWKQKKRNFQVGDIVLLNVDSPRNEWPMAKVIETYPAQDGLIRQVKLKINVDKTLNTTELLRPISKLVLLVANEVESPPRSQNENQD